MDNTNQIQELEPFMDMIFNLEFRRTAKGSGGGAE